MSIVYYAAYHGDVPDFHASFEHEGAEINGKLEHNLRLVAKALLVGWYSTSENPEIADAAGVEGQRFIAAPHAVAMRATEDGWTIYNVEFTSEDLVDAVIEVIDHGSDLGDMPAPWPEFMRREPAAR